RAALVETHLDGVPRTVDRAGVAVVREEWRVVDRWWTEEPVDRRYFDVVLEAGGNRGGVREGEREAGVKQGGGLAPARRGSARRLDPGQRRIREVGVHGLSVSADEVHEPGVGRVQVQELRLPRPGVREAVQRSGRRGDEAAGTDAHGAVFEQELDLALEHVE